MEDKYVKFENGRIVETNNENDLYIEWDGIYYIYYGKSNHNYQHNGKTYDCFPIVRISEDLSKVIDISLFGCKDYNYWEDGYIDVGFIVEDWEDCKDFYELMKSQSTYQMGEC